LIWLVNAAFVAKMRTIDATGENPPLQALPSTGSRKLTGC
jgi:hypothetical protein